MGSIRRIQYIIVFLVISITSYSQIRFGKNPISVGDEINYANPKKYEIGGITVSGTQFLDPNSLISIIGLKVGDEVTVPGSEISNAISKLWDQGILGDIQVTASKIEGKYIFLDFYLTDRPRLSKFSFTGIKRHEADDLREKIRLIRGKVVTDALLKNTINIINRYYFEKGFMNATVTVTQSKDTLLANSIFLKIAIDKKEKVKINSISFEGNTAFKPEQLRRKMKDTKEKRPYRIFSSSKFLAKSYADDKEKIIAKYNALGFRDAAIEYDTVVKVSDKLVDIKMTINEGKKYYFRNITWVGNYLHSDNELSTMIGIKRGEVFNQETLEKRLFSSPTGTDISSLYLDDGYLFFNVEPVEVLVDGDSIDFEMRVYEGSQATIDKIYVVGNTKTSDHVIMRELRTLPGQKFSRSDIIRTQMQLSQLGYFDAEKIGINPIPNQRDGTVDIEYTLTEKPSDQIQLSGGWGGFFGFVGTLGVTFNNFSARKIFKFKEYDPLPGGDGQRLSLQFQANGKRFQMYSLSFTEPWVGGKNPNALTVSLSHSVQNSLTSDQKKIGGLQVSGISTFLSRRLKWPDDYFSITHSLSYNIYNLSNYDITLGRGGINFRNGKANNISFNTTIARNSLDKPMYPRSGSAISLSITATPPYSMFNNTNYRDRTLPDSIRFKWIEFHKWIFDGSWFYKVAGDLVFNSRLHFGYIGSYQPTTGIGPFERYFMGGSGLTGINWILGYELIGLRGYADNSFIGSKRGGGTSFAKYVMELRYPISLNPMATVWVHSFLEAGNVWDNPKQINPFYLNRAGGLGARFYLAAMGALVGVDYGIGFDRSLRNDPDKSKFGNFLGSKGQFTFTIGQQIR